MDVLLERSLRGAELRSEGECNWNLLNIEPNRFRFGNLEKDQIKLSLYIVVRLRDET